jgi:hypothetical protein
LANTVIQILRSYSNTAPEFLDDGALAYSFVSNTLFIGSSTANSNNIIAIGGNAFISYAQSAYTHANAAFNAANTKFSSNGGTITGSVVITNNLSVSGDLVVTGNVTTENVYSFTVVDPLIQLGVGNYTSDLKDIGFASHYNAGTNAHTGLIRDSGTKDYYFFQGYTPILDSNNNVVITDPSFAKANVQADYFKGNLIANTVVVNGIDLVDVNNTQNTRLDSIETINTNQNNSITIIQGVDVTQNTRLNSIETINTNQNNSITIIQGVDATQNTRLDGIEGTNTTQNTRINSIETINTDQNTSISIIQGVDTWQNTQITYVNQFAGGAYDKANAAYAFANNISGSLSGNSIVLGANTAGLLVSNAVTMTETTYITNGIAQLNQVLGKLVPASPPNFPGAYRAITISSLVGPYRMANFTQQDNSSNSRTVAGGTSTTVLRSSSYTTSTIINVGPGDSGTLTVYKNNVSSGARTLVAGNGNAGTYNDLVILNNVDYSTITSAASGFWSSMNVRASGTVSNGWNEVYLSDTGTGDRTNVAYWYYDNSAPGTPTFASASIVPLSTSLTYSSTVPHYNSSTTFKLGVDVSKLSGDMFPASNTFFTGTAGGAFAAPASNTYPTVGITYPLIRNLYVSSGSVTVNTTSTIVSGFGSSATGPSVTVDNSYATGSQAFTTALGSTVLYKTGTASSMEETAVTFGSTVGTGSGLAARIINPGSTDTPTQSASASLFDSQIGTLQVYDATIVAATLKHDQTNYSTGYLPAGPNLSSGRTGSQYFTFRFVRTSVSKFDIQFTGTIAGLWVAVPGSAIDTAASATNGWVSMAVAYGGAGIPSNGCALDGVVTLNSAVTNHRKTCTFGTVSSSDTGTNEIYVRIKLTSGQTVTALSLQTASN